MNLHNKVIDLKIGKKKFKINYAYNNYTKYQDLLEYVYSLFSDLKNADIELMTKALYIFPDYHVSYPNHYMHIHKLIYLSIY